MNRLHTSLQSVAWKWQFEFVLWFSDWICGLQTWGKGSRELERLVSNGDSLKGYDPMLSGRRLAESETHVAATLQHGAHQARSWTSESFSGISQLELNNLKTAVGASFTLASKRFKYVSELPWLLARLAQAGVAKRCLDLYNMTSVHHGMTELFLGRQSSLRVDVLRINPDGSGVSDHLSSYIKIIELIPGDDSIAESPHAVSNRIGRHSAHSGPAWSAATMRAPQNMVDVPELGSALGLDIQELWLRHSSVLQTLPQKLNKPVRCTPNEFQARLYELGRFSAPTPTTSTTASDLDEQQQDDFAPDDHDDDSTAAAAAVEDPPDDDRSNRPENIQELSLMREYLLSSLKPSMFVSMPNPEADEISDTLIFFQVLAVQQTCVTVESFKPKASDSDAPFLSVSIQPFERMLPMHDDQAHVFIFADEFPCDIDWGACTPKDRSKFLAWELQGPSTIDDCLLLLRPKVLGPAMDLLDRSAPTLMLLDALADRGWVKCMRITEHNAESSLHYDCRKPLTKRRYYQCLLLASELYGAGVSFRSGKPQAYYDYILRKRRLPEAGKSMADLIKELKGTSEADAILPPMPAPPEPSALALLDCDVAWDLADVPPVPVPVPPDAGLEPIAIAAEAAELEPGLEPIGDHDDDAVIADELPEGETAPRRHTRDWPTELHGHELLRIVGRRGGSHAFAARLGIKCPCCYQRSRSTELLTAELGAEAVLCYLGAWIQALGTMPAAEHRVWQPTMEQMQAYRSAHFPG